MGAASAPALPLAIAVTTGVVLARLAGRGAVVEASLWGSSALIVALLLPRTLGSVLAAAAGFLVAWLGSPVHGEAERLDLARPVLVCGRSGGSWRRSALGWSQRMRVETVRQDRLEVEWPEEVLLLIPAVDRPPGERRLCAKGRLTLPPRLANGVYRMPPLWRLAVKSVRLLTPAVERTERAPPPRDWLRLLTEHALDRPSRPAAVAIARALVLGDPSNLPSDWLLALRRAGLGHLLAVSGLHIGLAISIAWTLSLALRPRHRFAPCGLVVFAYLAVVGPRPSLVRSALMAVLALASLAGERKPVLLNTWGVSIVSMVLLSPRIVEQLGFQLTAAATLGLLTLGPVLRERMSGRMPRLGSALAASIAAHIATLPWSLVAFHQWTPGAVLLNLIAIPWTALTLLVSFGAVALGWVGGVGDVIWWLLDQLSGPFGWLAELPVRGLVSHSVAIDWFRALIAAALMTAASFWRSGVRSAALVTLAVTVILLPNGMLTGAARGPEIIMLDVGQGEAVLLRDGTAAILIDGGGGLAPGLASREVVPALRLLGVDRLTGVLLTHPDLDHSAGLGG